MFGSSNYWEEVANITKKQGDEDIWESILRYINAQHNNEAFWENLSKTITGSVPQNESVFNYLMKYWMSSGDISSVNIIFWDAFLIWLKRDTEDGFLFASPGKVDYNGILMSGPTLVGTDVLYA